MFFKTERYILRSSFIGIPCSYGCPMSSQSLGQSKSDRSTRGLSIHLVTDGRIRLFQLATVASEDCHSIIVEFLTSNARVICGWPGLQFLLC